MTAPSLLVAVTAPFAGMLADRFGSGRQLLVGAMLFVLAGTAGLWLDSLGALMISRLVLGVAVALVMTAQTALVGDHFTGPARTNFMGLQLAATNLSGFVFLLVAGWLAGLSPFLPFAIYAVALLYLPFMRSVSSTKERSKADAQAAAAAGARGWPAKIAAAALLAGLSLVGFYLVPTQVPFHLAQLGYTAPSTTGLVLAAVTLSSGLFSLVYSRARRVLGRGMTFALGFAFFTAGFGALSQAGGLWSVLGAGLLIGAATGLLFPAFLQISIDIAPAGRRGAASGVMTTAIFLGQFLSPLAGRPLIGAVGYDRTFALTAAMFCVLGLVSLIMFRDRADHA